MSSERAPFCYAHPRPALTVDVVVIHEAPQESKDSAILLIRRAHPPFVGNWALPGGFVNEGENPLAAASRELEEEAGLQGLALGQIGAFAMPGRDPRGWVVSIAYVARVRTSVALVAGDDAAAARWWPVDNLPSLAFDHADIIAAALRRQAPAPHAHDVR
jgi:8-oxo-dGTP diphosphatase